MIYLYFEIGSPHTGNHACDLVEFYDDQMSFVKEKVRELKHDHAENGLVFQVMQGNEIDTEDW